MSQENVNLAATFIDAYNRRDAEFLEEHVAEDAELVPWEGVGMDAKYMGTGGVRKYFEDAMSWSEIQVEVEGIRDAGSDTVVFWGNLRAVGAASGASVAQPLAWILHFDGRGKLKALQTYEGLDDALEAVGLSE